MKRARASTLQRVRRKVRARLFDDPGTVTYRYPALDGGESVAGAGGRRSTVVFHRDFRRFQGGHLKVYDYFQHVRSSPAHDARIRFTPQSTWEGNPWSGLRETVVAPGESIRADVLFLAGLDWNVLEPEQRARPPVPVVNLIQGLRHANPQHPNYRFLAHPAIRICVSTEVREALEGTGRVRGPMLTVPIGIDLEGLPPARPAAERDLDCVVLAVKDPPLGRAIAERVRAAGYGVRLVDEHISRDALLDAMARARVCVHVPVPVEGAYMPALESMALGVAVVCPDCVGNRSFCRDGDTAAVPQRSERAMAQTALSLLSASAEELQPMLASAREESERRAMGAERARFLEILGRVEDLWESV